MNDKKIAYLILAHQDFENLHRLINRLDYKSDFFIHIDGKINIDELIERYKERKNIYFIENRLAINWAGFNMVLATNKLIKLALQTNINYSHLVLLSGGDYPIKNKEYIYDFFMKNENVEFIRAYSLNDSNCKHCENRVIRHWFFDLNISKNALVNKIYRKILTTILIIKNKRKSVLVNNKELDIYFGSQWWALTPSCARYILNYIENNKEINYYFKDTFAPDEIYYHTIVFNSPYCKNTINKGVEKYSSKWKWNNLHYLKTDTLDCNYKNKNNIVKRVFGKFNGSISPCTESDFEEVKNSKYLYMRKVNTIESKKLLDLIDDIIL